MAAIVSRTRSFVPPKSFCAITESAPVRWTLTAIAVGFLSLFLLMPLVAVFYEAFKKGVELYLATFSDPYAIDAIRLTLTVAAISVPLNLLFGLAAAWAITKFTFRGKSLSSPCSTCPSPCHPSSRA